MREIITAEFCLHGSKRATGLDSDTLEKLGTQTTSQPALLGRQGWLFVLLNGQSTKDYLSVASPPNTSHAKALGQWTAPVSMRAKKHTVFICISQGKKWRE